jgi:hypothetical protein
MTAVMHAATGEQRRPTRAQLVAERLGRTRCDLLLGAHRVGSVFARSVYSRFGDGLFRDDEDGRVEDLSRHTPKSLVQRLICCQVWWCGSQVWRLV